MLFLFDLSKYFNINKLKFIKVKFAFLGLSYLNRKKCRLYKITLLSVFLSVCLTEIQSGEESNQI